MAKYLRFLGVYLFAVSTIAGLLLGWRVDVAGLRGHLRRHDRG